MGRAPHHLFCAKSPPPVQAPRTSNSQITQMVDNTSALAREFSKRECPIIFFCDTHEADKPEPPYPPHCIRGTGEEILVPGTVTHNLWPSETGWEKSHVDELPLVLWIFSCKSRNLAFTHLREEECDAVVSSGLNCGTKYV